MAKEENFTYAGDYPLIENGIYEAQFVKSKDVLICKTWKRMLTFKITEPGKYHGIKLFMAFNMPYDKKVKQGSKYYKTYCMVNGWRKPTRNAILSPLIFKNKLFRIKTRKVIPELNKKPMPEQFWYSVVDEIEPIT